MQVLELHRDARKTIYAVAGCLTVIGIFAMRWNVVIGGQLVLQEFPRLHLLQRWASRRGKGSYPRSYS